MGRRQPPNEEVVVKVDFPFPIDKPTFTKLVLDLAKNLLLQKNQIPLQYEAIAKEVEIDAIQLAGESEQDSDQGGGEDFPSKLSVREKIRMSRARKSKAQLVKHGRKLIDDLNNLENVIEDELEREEVSSINFVFGATAHSGREIYSVEVPDGIHSDYSSSSSRIGIHLFRAMLANEALQDRLTSKIPVSNMFTVISRRNLIPSSDLLHLPDYSLPVTSRSSRVRFQFSFPPPPSLVATRRLRFTSGADTRETADTPSMELCTPFTRARVMTRTMDMELCTPAVRWKTPHTGLLHSPGMELCTPAVTRPARDPQCTPSMEMCTPLVTWGKLGTVTPAVTSVPSSMELCTPASNNVVSSMDMCTPLLGGGGVTEDSLEVKTPDIGDLSLESPNKRKKVSHNDEEDMKDSGISSPDLSRREMQEDCPKLHWFIIEDPIRGFKYKPY